MQVLESPGSLKTLVIQFSLKPIFCTIIFGFLFPRSLLLLISYCALGSPGKIYPSPENVLEKSWKIGSEKGYKP